MIDNTIISIPVRWRPSQVAQFIEGIYGPGIRNAKVASPIKTPAHPYVVIDKSYSPKPAQ